MSAHDDGRAGGFDAAADDVFRMLEEPPPADVFRIEAKLTEQDLADIKAMYLQGVADGYIPADSWARAVAESRPTPMPRSAVMLGRLVVAFLLLTIAAAFVVLVVIVSAAALADGDAATADEPVVDVVVGWALVALGVAALVVYGVWSALARRRGGAP